MPKQDKNQTWENYKKIPFQERIKLLTDKQGIFDIIYSQQFDRFFLDKLYHLTNKIRSISKSHNGKKWLSQLLSNYRAMLYFIQPSTRTFLSFSSACHILGIQVFDVRSVETSSEMKGESFEDTIRTFSSFFDLVIIRYPEPGYAELASFAINQSGRPIPVINAGSGRDQHPTQALLDIYTLRKSFEEKDNGDLKNKTIMMVGDLKRGRTVRSLSYLLSNFKNIKIIFSSPPSFKMENDIIEFLKKNDIEVIESSDFKKHLHEVDAIYMTRIQNEYKLKGVFEEKLKFDDFNLTEEHLKILKKDAVILHPLPRRNEIAPSIDNDKRAIYWRQVRNGMWTRAALLAKLLGVEDDILKFDEKENKK